MNIGCRPIPLIRLAAVAGAAALTLSACSSGSGSGSVSGGGKLKVTASFYPMEFLARRIGGDQVTVTDLTKPGVEPHDLELSPKQTAALGESDVIVYLKGLQPAVDDAVAQSGVKNTVDAASLTTLENHGTEVDGKHHTTGENGSRSTQEGAGADPHIWPAPGWGRGAGATGPPCTARWNWSEWPTGRGTRSTRSPAASTSGC